MSEDRKEGLHSIICEQRKKLNMSGVKEVKTFDEETVVLDTVGGQLTVRGEDLIIDSFSAVTGDLFMHGNIYAMVYTDDRGSKGFMRKLLK